MSTLTVPYVYTIDRKIRLWRDSQTQTHTERQRDGETETERAWGLDNPRRPRIRNMKSQTFRNHGYLFILPIEAWYSSSSSSSRERHSYITLWICFPESCYSK